MRCSLLLQVGSDGSFGPMILTNEIMSSFRVVSFYEAGVIEAAQRMRKTVSDCVDCILLATAITSKEDLVTKDSLILEKKGKLLKEHGVKLLSFRDLTNA